MKNGKQERMKTDRKFLLLMLIFITKNQKLKGDSKHSQATGGKKVLTRM